MTDALWCPWMKTSAASAEPLVSPFSCLFQVFIVESLGRRILLLAGFVLCCSSCAVLTLALNLQVCLNGSGGPSHDFWTSQGAGHWNILRMLLHPGEEGTV